MIYFKDVMRRDFPPFTVKAIRSILEAISSDGNITVSLAIIRLVAASCRKYHHIIICQSLVSDYDCILVMLLGSSKNGRLEVDRFTVPTNSGTANVRNALCNMSGLTAPGSLNTCPMCLLREEVDL